MFVNFNNHYVRADLVKMIHFELVNEPTLPPRIAILVSSETERLVYFERMLGEGEDFDKIVNAYLEETRIMLAHYSVTVGDSDG